MVVVVVGHLDGAVPVWHARRSPSTAIRPWIEGRFVRPSTQSPVGPLEPTGERVVMNLMDIFRFDD